jgi:hypothetical protein
MLTKEQKQIDDLQTDLGVRFSPDMGGTPPNIEEMINLIGIGKAARSLLREINGIFSHVEFDDFKIAEEKAKALEPKNPFMTSTPEVLAPPVE